MTAELVISLIVIVLFYFAYHYLVQLESCLCAQASADGKSPADLQMLKYVELFLIAILVLGIVGLYSKILRSSALVAMIMAIAVIAVYVIVMIHVYRLYNNMPADCECAIKWPRYVLYVQWISYTLAIVTMVVGVVLGFYRGVSKGLEKVESVEKATKVSRRGSSKRRAGRR